MKEDQVQDSTDAPDHDGSGGSVEGLSSSFGIKNPSMVHSSEGIETMAPEMIGGAKTKEENVPVEASIPIFIPQDPVFLPHLYPLSKM